MREPVVVEVRGWSGPLGYVPKPTQAVTVHVAGPVPSTGQLALTLTTASGEQITAVLPQADAYDVAGGLTRAQLPAPVDRHALVAEMAGQIAAFLSTLPPAEAKRRMVAALAIATKAKSRRVPVQAVA